MDSGAGRISTLLTSVNLSSSSLETLDHAVTAITAAIKSIPTQPATPTVASAFIRDLGAPADKLPFTFHPPSHVTVAGSHSLNAVSRPDIGVDILVRIPQECFHEKDYLNYRYHAKRGIYLRVIERSLRELESVGRIEWATFQNEARKPVLIVYPVTEDAELSGFYVRIIPSAKDVFNVSKLNMTRNNVRAFSEGAVGKPTPKYNSSVLEDMFLEENAEFIEKTFQGWKSLSEALILLKVWSRNRSSINTHDCLNGYLISIILSYLAGASGGKYINKTMDAMQIFRVTLNFIATSNMPGTGLSLQPLGNSGLTKKDMNQYRQSFEVVFLSGHVNLTLRMTQAAFSELQDEASRTLKCIDKCKDSGFEELFMTKVDFAAKFDTCLRINFKGNARVSPSAFCMDDERWKKCEDDVHSLLQQALTDRAKLIRSSWRSLPCEWNIGDGFSKFGDEPMIIGIIFSSQEKSFRVVDVGPNADDKEAAAKFRKFWGDKSDLRRFKDGKIAESTVWDCEPWERHLVVKKIVEYVLCKHFHVSKEDMLHSVDQLDFCLHLGGKDPISSSGTLLGAFEVLSKRLRLLEEIPLRVSSVQSLDPAFRHTSVFPPQPHPLAFEKGVRNSPNLTTTSIQPLEVMIQLEGSGNWPLDSVATAKTKSAFLLKIGESLQDRWGMFCTATEDEVDVLMSGYAFRLKIFHERGLNSLKIQVGNDKESSSSSVDKELFIRSQHSSMINGFHGRYSSYGPVVRLAKRWFSSHLFSSFLREEAIELIVAYIFLKPFPFHAPDSRISGFLRFLRLLSSYDWTFSPMVVDINEDFTSQDEKEITENFMLSRKDYDKSPDDIKPAMFLATTYDKASEAWTKFLPNKTVLKRIAAYARSSSDLLTNLILQGQTGPYTWECLFRTPLNNYDAVVLLHRDKLSYPHHLLFPAELKHGKHVIRGTASKEFDPYIQLGGPVRSLEDGRNKLMINFDPVRYFLEDIKKEFPDTFAVWYDSLGSDAVGLTWENKDSKKRRRDEAEETIRDPLDMLKTVGEVGKGFVKSVYLLKAPRLRV